MNVKVQKLELHGVSEAELIDRLKEYADICLKLKIFWEAWKK